ncbi:unnamed protein product, partial [Effrenium voratum]
MKRCARSFSCCGTLVMDPCEKMSAMRGTRTRMASPASLSRKRKTQRLWILTRRALWRT